jgi:hypothetical protein
VSAEALAIVLHHSQAKGTDKLVLVGIANHDGDGGSWPATETLAYYANVEPRNVQKSVDRLVALGEITRDRNAGGTASMAEHMRPNLYEVVLRCPPNCDGSKRHVLVCDSCGKPLRGPHKRRRLPRHPGCAHMIPSLTVEGVTPASPPDAGVTRTTHEHADSTHPCTSRT